MIILHHATVNMTLFWDQYCNLEANSSFTFYNIKKYIIFLSLSLAAEHAGLLFYLGKNQNPSQMPTFYDQMTKPTVPYTYVYLNLARWAMLHKLKNNSKKEMNLHEEQKME